VSAWRASTAGACSIRASALLLGAYALGSTPWPSRRVVRIPKADLFLARALCVLVAVLAVENVLTLLSKGTARGERPQARILYEKPARRAAGSPGRNLHTSRNPRLPVRVQGFETWFYQFQGNRVEHLAPATGMRAFKQRASPGAVVSTSSRTDDR